MSFARRMFMAQNVKRAVAGCEITFTVKEWFLDPDNSFTDTEVAALQYMTVKIGSETKQTDANGQVVFNLVDGSYTYEVYDNARYLTTYRDDITVSGAAQSINVKSYACLYKPTDVWDMINNDSYVPVASGAELDSLRNTGSRTMGAKTIFVGSYATGLDKKYVQVKHVSLIDYQTGAGWTPIGTFAGTIDGNLLNISQLYINRTGSNSGLFSVSTGILKNISLSGELISTGDNNGLLAGYVGGANASITNCTVRGTLTGAGSSGGMIGVAGSLVGNRGLYVNDCYSNVTVNGTDVRTGGFIGYVFGDATNDVLIENSISICNVSSTGRSVGGFVGTMENFGLIKNCYSIGSALSSSATTGSFVGGFAGVIGSNANTSIIEQSYSFASAESTNSNATNGRGVGGFVGLQQGTSIVRNCYAHGSATSNGGQNVGGFVGMMAFGTGARTILNCYSKGAVSTTSGTGIGGFCGDAASGSIITNSYYDTQTSGQSDTGKGLPRTTAQMQAGTASSFILPNGSIDPDSLPANAMYLNWDGNIWEFGTTSEYPTLK